MVATRYKVGAVACAIVAFLVYSRHKADERDRLKREEMAVEVMQEDERKAVLAFVDQRLAASLKPAPSPGYVRINGLWIGGGGTAPLHPHVVECQFGVSVNFLSVEGMLFEVYDSGLDGVPPISIRNGSVAYERLLEEVCDRTSAYLATLGPQMTAADMIRIPQRPKDSVRD